MLTMRDITLSGCVSMIVLQQGTMAPPGQSDAENQSGYDSGTMRAEVQIRVAFSAAEAPGSAAKPTRLRASVVSGKTLSNKNWLSDHLGATESTIIKFEMRCR
jgi:hypothetical protein